MKRISKLIIRTLFMAAIASLSIETGVFASAQEEITAKHMDVYYNVRFGRFKKLKLAPHDVEDLTCDANSAGIMGYDDDQESLRVCKVENGNPAWSSVSGLWAHKEDPSDVHNVFLVDTDNWTDTALEEIRLGIGTSTPKSALHIIADKRTDVDYLDSSMDAIIVEGQDVGLHLLGEEEGSTLSHILLSETDDVSASDHWIISGDGPASNHRFNISYGFSTQPIHVYDNSTLSDIDHISIQTSGRIGFGTAWPSMPFHVRTEGTDEEVQLLLRGKNPDIALEDNSSLADGYKIEVDDDKMFFMYQNVPANDPVVLDLSDPLKWYSVMTLTNGAYVGIGTENPAAHLHLLSASSGDDIHLEEGTPEVKWINSTDQTEFSFQSLDDRLTFKSRDIPVDPAAGYNRMILSNTGLLGLGTENPQAMLDVNDGNIADASDKKMRVQSEGNVEIIFDPDPDPVLPGDQKDYRIHYGDVNGVNDFNIEYYDGSTYTTFFSLYPSGKVGIGQTNPEHQLHITGSDGIVRIESDESGRTELIFLDQDGDDSNFMTECCADTTDGEGIFYIKADANSDGVYEKIAMTIHSSGKVGVGGVSDPSDGLDVEGDMFLVGCYKADLSGTLGGTCASDETLKKNIEPIEHSLEKLSALKPVTYQYKDEAHGSGQQTGLVAQEVREVYPEWVSKDQNGHLNINYGLDIQMQLIQGVKELKERNTKLKERIEALENRL